MPAEPVRKPRILVLNQYYAPGLEATAQLLAALCEGIADEFDIHVVTGRLRDREGGEPGRFERNGVDVERVRSTAFDRRRLALRALNYLTFLVQSLRAGLAAEKPDVVFCMTDPPIIANIALVVARRFRVPLVVVSQDVFPEVAVELRRLTNPAVVRVLRVAISHYLQRADRVVAIGDTMRRRLVAKGARPETVSIIPNWVDTTFLTPQPRDNAWAREQGLGPESFVVMHSGNVGHAQNLDALLRAFTFLRDLTDVRLVIIGDGARYLELTALAERLDLGDRSLFLKYQNREVLPQSLSSADLHVVGLARGLSGYVVPSRLYGVLSVARPVIVAADQESETAQIVTAVGCGVVVPPARPELLALAIRRAYERRDELPADGELGRAYVTQEADAAVAIGRYRALLRQVVA
jgi:glycosyltransferase involved in cell wall biosynthesis